MITVQRALDILEPIPKKKFIINNYSCDIKGKHCSIGFIAVHFANCEIGIDYSTPEILEFRCKTRDYIRDNHEEDFQSDITRVNDSRTVNGYTEHHPKDRVIHLLKDMLFDGY